MNTQSLALFCSVLSGLMFAPILTVVLVVLEKIFITPFLRKGYLRRAKAAGHVIRAKRVRDYISVDADNPFVSHPQTIVYAYNVKGREYRYRAVTHIYRYAGEYDEIDLYYIKNPRRACQPKELGFKEFPYLLLQYLFSAVLISIVMLGYFAPLFAKYLG